ncbi:MAG: cell division protein SepF [Oscillospiraceae bacterium]|nr:cell division protein SepF [Oscillospiraceae bacterium]
MGFMEKFKEWAKVEEDEDEFEEFMPSDDRAKVREVYAPQRRDDRVVNIHTTTQLQVVLVKPERYENATEIADHLKEKRTVVLNLESTNKDAARRILDFLSGVAYTNDGQIKRVANNTYIITPYNVDLKGDLIDELENNGLYF